MYLEVLTLFRTYLVIGSPFFNISAGSGKLTKTVRRVRGLGAGVNHVLKKSLLSSVGAVGVDGVSGLAGVTGDSGVFAEAVKTGRGVESTSGLEGTILPPPKSEADTVVIVDDLVRPVFPNLNFELPTVPFLFMLENKRRFFLPSAAASDLIDSAMTECAVLVVRSR